MAQNTVTVSAKDEKTAHIKGAEELGAKPEDVVAIEEDPGTFSVSLKNAHDQLEISVREDKMAAFIKTISPPAGDAGPVTVEDVQKALNNLKILAGIDHEAINEAITTVSKTGAVLNNIRVAVGEPAKKGEDGRIELKIGHDAVNRDPQARNMVRPGQVLAARIPATRGTPGWNIFDEEVPPLSGAEIEFSAGDNVNIAENNTKCISNTYGMAQADWKGISVTNAVQVDSGEMWADMPIVPKLADDSSLSYNDLAKAMEQAGVVHGIKEDAISALIKEGKPAERFRVAEATPAQDGVDARIAFEFLLNRTDPETVDAERSAGQLDEKTILKETVGAREILARKTPLIEPVEGRNVKGIGIPGAEPVDKPLQPGINVTVSDDDLTFFVAEDVVGYANYIGGEVCVEEPLRVTDDKMEVYLSVQPPSESGKLITREIVDKMLADAGVVYGVEHGAIEEALAKAVSEDKPIHDVLIAEGKKSIRGEDARIEFEVLPYPSAGAVDTKTGNIDFKERGTVQNVKPGDILATKVPRTPGTDGMNVFGDIVPAESGIDKDLIPVSNVAVSEDGLTYAAEIEGVFSLTQEVKIGVFQIYEVEGDVDYTTGNLSVDGALLIKGWIRSGFDVHSKSELRVGGGIESANVHTNGNLYVQGGILGSDENDVHAGCDIMVRFIENARVHAEGNIIVRDQIMRSNVSAKGKILVTEGKGRIRGSSLEASKGIEANELGSEAAVKTLVSAGANPEQRKRMSDVKKKLGELKRNRAKMDMVLARYEGKVKNKSLPKQTVNKLARLSKLRREVVLDQTKLEKYLKGLLQQMVKTDEEPVTVKVNRAVFTGTTVMVRGYSYQIQEDIKGKAAFSLNIEQQVVEIAR
ncbi:flagellar assembly protein A [Thermodesulfobacteriota bacterium]